MEDDRLVQLALERGHITREQLEAARREQRSLADRGVDHTLFFLLQDLGHLDEQKARDLRKHVSSARVRALEVEGYVIQGRIGSGGMGDVFRGRNAQGGEAAIKLLSQRLSRDPEHVRRFLREVRATQRLDHPHIVRTLGSGEVETTRYMVMELVTGVSLKQRLLDQGSLTEAEALALLGQMGSALRHAWSLGVLHRDIKPANILLGPPRPGHAEPFCAKLCDFGLARVWQQDGDADVSHGQLTGSGLALGTPHYMSPEQASGEHDVDQRSDIYGLGATLYHALLGHTMYSGKSSAVIMYKQVTEGVDLEELRKRAVGEPLVALLGRMLAKRRDKRIATWDEVLAGLAQIAPAAAPTAATAAIQPAAAAAEVGEEDGPALPRWRRWLPWTVMAVLVAVLVAGMAVAVGTAATPPVVADPATVQQCLDREGGRRGARVLVLAPGVYHGPLRLGAGHAQLTIRAAGAGVVVEGSPAVQAEPGLDVCLLAGLTLRAEGGGPALTVTAGSRLVLAGATVEGGARVGGALELRESRLAGGVQIDGGNLHAAASRLAGLLDSRSGRISLDHCRLVGPADGPALVAEAGTLAAAGVVIDAPGGDGLRVAGSELRLADVQVSAAGTALAAVRAAAPQLAHLSLRGAPALRWSGARDPAWDWQALAVDGPCEGLAAPAPGAGARAPRLAGIPP